MRWRGLSPIAIGALLSLGCSCGAVEVHRDTGPDLADAACVRGEVCSEEPLLLSVGDEPNREAPYGPAALEVIGDHVLGAAHIAGRRGEGSPGELVVFHYDVRARTYELVDRRPDGIALVRGGRTDDAATLIAPIDASEDLWARRYRVSVGGEVSSDTFPMRGTAVPVDVAGSSADLVVDYHIDAEGQPVLAFWDWPSGGSPAIHRVSLAGVSELASPSAADIQAARAIDGRVAVFMNLPGSFTIVVVNAALSAVEAVGMHRGATGITITRRMFVRWGSDFLLTTEHGIWPEQHSEFWSVSRDGEVRMVARLEDGLFVRDMSPGPDGSALIVAARITDGYEPPSAMGGVQRGAETWFLRLDATGCLHGDDRAAFRGTTTAFAISPLGAGAAVLGLRNPGIDETKLELALLCALPD